MEKITINPKDCEVFGNIIGYEKGYLESDEDFQSHKCEVHIQDMKPGEYDPFNVYSFKLTPNNALVNMFNDDIAYCKSESLGSLYVCEHFYELDKSETIFNITKFTNGYKLTLKDKYISDYVDATYPFFLLILQDSEGVSIPSNAKKVLFSTTYDASPYIRSIKAGFVFFDENKTMLNVSNNPTQGVEIGNEATGNTGRISISADIPRYAKYVGVEFQFPEGVGKTVVDDVSVYDYISLQLNCLLFDQTYGGFVKND